MKPQWACTSWRKPWKSLVVISFPYTKESVHMVEWRFFSRQKVMKTLLMGTGHKPLHSVNCYNSRARGCERYGLLT
jgi:hypothetical protein